MGLESVTKITDLNVLWPLGTDLRQYGDDHLRAIKRALKSLLTDVEQIGFHEYTVVLSDATTEIGWAGDAPIAGQRLTVFVTQPGAGGKAITWDATKYKYTTTEISVVADSVTVFNFVGKDDGFWYMCTPPMEVE